MTTLYVDTTDRYQNAATCDLCARIIVENGKPVIYRPISHHITRQVANWPDAFLTAAEDRTQDQHTAIETGETLGAEFFAAKDIIFNIPLTGGVIPASFKSWVEMIALADLDMDADCADGFRSKRATLVVASGGLKAGSELDDLTPHLIHLLDFIGIDDVNIVSADQSAPPSQTQNNWANQPMPIAA